MEAAFQELNKAQLKPFLMRIWGQPEPGEVESGQDINTLNAENATENEGKNGRKFLSTPRFHLTYIDFIANHIKSLPIFLLSMNFLIFILMCELISCFFA